MGYDQNDNNPLRASTLEFLTLLPNVSSSHYKIAYEPLRTQGSNPAGPNKFLKLLSTLLIVLFVASSFPLEATHYLASLKRIWQGSGINPLMFSLCNIKLNGYLCI